MRSIECEGDSIDQAIENALRALELERERVQIEILADATRGLFGLGGKKARVRATVRASLASSLAEETLEAVRRSVPRETSERPSQVAKDVREDTPETARSVSAVVVPDGLQERSRAILSELLALVGVTASVKASPGPDPGTILLEVSGDSSGLLIGRRGQTLEALEYMLNRIVGRDGDVAARVTIDVERYRERRREYLETLAHRLADKARQTRRPVTLNPMSPRDRRIVHLALQGNASVVTRSQGEGHFRKLLILPAERVRRAPTRSSS
jgi:spoIIIJ-associated protein